MGKFSGGGKQNEGTGITKFQYNANIPQLDAIFSPAAIAELYSPS
jgi:hypothetical protein